MFKGHFAVLQCFYPVKNLFRPPLWVLQLAELKALVVPKLSEKLMAIAKGKLKLATARLGFGFL